ncbi:MAG TPA: TetR/AcrR family transcriptional regulator [Jatrophihabitans sp.]|uniref:TetR/AcrR family transcriptional regulator n=1 Tax=Jatrophihabitans sp. TaxID=1932789 RepID=UPI002DFCCFD3|nr:TetR/AcrR family transcriptional regulator [Jatrophihabitans sp.]
MTAPSAVRDRVLDAAVELFAQQGYDGTSVAQVVARAGVAKGGFYHHFASKEALLYEVYGDLITRQLAVMDDLVARGRPAAETLRALIVDLVTSTAASARQALVFGREMHRLGDERTEQYRRERRRYHDTVKQLIADGQASGEFAPVASADTVTFTIFGVVNELPLWYSPDGRKRPAELGDELADFVLAGLAPPATPSPEKTRTPA